MTTLAQRPPSTAEEVAQEYPRGLELQQVQIVLRHGERTPVHARFPNTGLPSHWPYCDSINRLKSVIREADGRLDSLTWRRRLESIAYDDGPTLPTGPGGEDHSICQDGELTVKGRETTLAFGQRLRWLYVEQLGFLPDVLDGTTLAHIRLRSTPIPRARESTEQAFTGLYPRHKRQSGLPPPTLVTRVPADETMFPNEAHCKRFAELARAFAARTAERHNAGPELQYINEKLGKWMPASSPTIRVDGRPRLSGIMDTINATLAHGPLTRLPAEFYDARVRAHIDRITTEEWFGGYAESREYRTLGIGAAVGDITQHMVQHARGDAPRPFRLGLAGGHDTTIAATLSALGVFHPRRDAWPPFTSRIVFELFRDARAAPSSAPASSPSSRTPYASLPPAERARLDGHWVRVRYNDRVVALPGCRAAGRHWGNDETVCSLRAFKEVVDEFTPDDWRAACARGLGERAFPARAERPVGVEEGE